MWCYGDTARRHKMSCNFFFLISDESIHFLIEAVVALSDKNIQGSLEHRSQLETITLEDSDDENEKKKDDKCCWASFPWQMNQNHFVINMTRHSRIIILNYKYTNPSRGILHFYKQKFCGSLPCSKWMPDCIFHNVTQFLRSVAQCVLWNVEAGCAMSTLITLTRNY